MVYKYYFRFLSVFLFIFLLSITLCVCVVWLQWLLGVCAVVSVLKSGISTLHLITASRNMAAIDLADRESERSKTK